MRGFFSRMREDSLTFVTIVSTLLCVSACVLWAQSYVATLRIRYYANIGPNSFGDFRTRPTVFGISSGRFYFATGAADYPIREAGTIDAAFWPNGGFSEFFRLGSGSRGDWITSYTFGSLILERSAQTTDWHPVSFGTTEPMPEHHFCGFGIGRVYRSTSVALSERDRYGYPQFGTLHEIQVVLPAWFVVVAFALLPARLRLRAYRVRRALLRAKAGYCPSCGYDLRATPGRCSECGWHASGVVLPPRATPR